MATAMGVCIAFLTGVIAPFALRSMWGLLALPTGLAAVLLLGGYLPLRAVTAEEYERAHAASHWDGLGSVLLLAVLVMAAVLRL